MPGKMMSLLCNKYQQFEPDRKDGEVKPLATVCVVQDGSCLQKGRLCQKPSVSSKEERISGLNSSSVLPQTSCGTPGEQLNLLMPHSFLQAREQ